MRFPILVAAASISGAVAVISFKTFFPQQDALLTATAREAIADVARFDFSALNPVQAAYNRVASEISNPKPIPGLNFQSTPVGEIKMVPRGGIGPLNLGGEFASRTNPQPRWHGTVMRCSRGGVTIPCD